MAETRSCLKDDKEPPPLIVFPLSSWQQTRSSSRGNLGRKHSGSLAACVCWLAGRGVWPRGIGLGLALCGISKMRLVIKLPRAGVLHQAGPGVGAWCSLNVEVVRRATRGALASNTYDSVAGGRGLTGTLRARSGLAQGARFSPLASTISGPVA